MLEVKNLTISLKKEYSKKRSAIKREDNCAIPIVEQLNFSVEKCKTLAIVGESGAGKTLTALSIMSLLDTNKFLVTGEVLFNSKDLFSLEDKTRKKLFLEEIAIVWQNAFRSLSPVEKIKTTIKNIYKIKNKKIDEKRIQYLFSKMQLDMYKMSNKYPYECSGGEMQRIMLLLSLLFSPRLLICDEITSSLDYDTSLSLITLLKTLKEENELSILFISHDMWVVKDLADDVLVMKNSKVLENASKHDIFSSPKSSYTKEMLKASYL
ncbi:MAG: ATP-binding cassette domain-containing protein [Treponema sp.]